MMTGKLLSNKRYIPREYAKIRSKYFDNCQKMRTFARQKIKYEEIGHYVDLCPCIVFQLCRGIQSCL